MVPEKILVGNKLDLYQLAGTPSEECRGRSLINGLSRSPLAILQRKVYRLVHTALHSCCQSHSILLLVTLHSGLPCVHNSR
jgi:hypothetical protein